MRCNNKMDGDVHKKIIQQQYNSKNIIISLLPSNPSLLLITVVRPPPYDKNNINIIIVGI